MTLIMHQSDVQAQDAPMFRFGEGWEGYVRHLNREGASPRTIQQRLPVVRRFVRETGAATLADITPDHVAAFLATPAFSPWTRSTYYGHLRSLFRWALEDGLVDVDPTVKVRRPSSRPGRPRPLTEDEARRVLDAARATDESQGTHLYAWLILSMFAGLRAHEVAKIRGEDVGEMQLYVLGKGQQEAFIPTHPLVWALAQRYPTHGWWFPSDLNDSGHILGGTVSRKVSQLFRSLGIAGSSHRGRHVYGTRLLRAGANIRVVQECMRHRSLSSTMVYTAVAEDEMRAAVLALSA